MIWPSLRYTYCLEAFDLLYILEEQLAQGGGGIQGAVCSTFKGYRY